MNVSKIDSPRNTVIDSPIVTQQNIDSHPLHQEKIQEEIQKKMLPAAQREALVEQLLEKLPQNIKNKKRCAAKLADAFQIEGECNFESIEEVDIAKLDDSVWKILANFAKQQPAITHIRLQKWKGTIPSQLSLLLQNGEIAQLDISHFFGKFIDLKTAGIKACARVNVYSPVRPLQPVKVPKGCSVHVLGAWFNNKVLVHRYAWEEDAFVDQEGETPAYGHAYLPPKHESVWETNLNGVFQFKPPIEGAAQDPQKNFIFCRLFSLAMGRASIDLQLKKQEQRKLRANAGAEAVPPSVQLNFYRDLFGTEEKVQKSIPSSMEKDWEAFVCKEAVEHDIRPVKEWGNYLEDQFAKLGEGDFFHAVIISCGGHAMTVMLERINGKKVIRYFDPNTSLTHMRIIEAGNESVAYLQLWEMFVEGKPGVELQFGNQVDDQWFDSIPLLPKVRLRPGQIPPVRSLRLDVSTQAPSPSLIFLLARLGFHEQLESILILNDPIAKVLLGEKNAKGVSPLYTALCLNHTATAKSIVRIILGSKSLSYQEKVTLLDCQDSKGTTAIAAIVTLNYLDTVRAILKMILASQVLIEEDKVALLKGRDATGNPVLYYELQDGDVAMGEVIVEVVLGSNLSKKAKETLLICRRKPDGISGIRMAIHEVHVDTVTMLFDTILNTSALDWSQKKRLLNQMNEDEEPEYVRALEAGKVAVVKAVVAAVSASAKLSAQQKEYFLTQTNADDVPLLAIALERGYTKIVRMIARAMLKLKLDAVPKEIMLACEGLSDVSGICKGYQYNQIASTKALTNIILNTKKLDVTQKGRLIAGPALRYLLSMGNRVAAEKMIDAILNTHKLDASQKAAMLAVTDANGRPVLYHLLNAANIEDMRMAVQKILATPALEDEQKKALLDAKTLQGIFGIASVRKRKDVTSKAMAKAFIALIKEHGWRVTSKHAIEMSPKK